MPRGTKGLDPALPVFINFSFLYLMHDLSLVVPAYNEALSLPKVLPDWLKFCQTKGCQPIIVNDGSRDETGEILDQYADEKVLTVVHHKVNRGYGGALKSGLRAAQTPYVMTIDADGQHRLEDVEMIYRVGKEKNTDMLVGRRPESGSGWYRSLGKALIRGFARLLLPVPIHDINSGMKLYRTELVQPYLDLCPDNMAFSDIITLVFLNNRHLVMEEPIQINPRTAGQSTIKTRTAVDTVEEILHIAILFHPMRIFMPIAFFLLAFGTLWGAPFLLRGEGVSVGAMLLLVSGLLFMGLGLLAEQLAEIRRRMDSPR